jgi:hypothetical protein
LYVGIGGFNLNVYMKKDENTYFEEPCYVQKTQSDPHQIEFSGSHENILIRYSQLAIEVMPFSQKLRMQKVIKDYFFNALDNSLFVSYS